MNTQQAYEQIRSHFSGPGAKLAKGGDTNFSRCSYRTEDGAKCAVGALIPDAMYSPHMECGGVDRLFEAYPVTQGYLYDVDITFLRAAQILHDSFAGDPTSFVAMLDLVAKYEFKLVTSENVNGVINNLARYALDRGGF